MKENLKAYFVFQSVTLFSLSLSVPCGVEERPSFRVLRLLDLSLLYSFVWILVSSLF